MPPPTPTASTPAPTAAPLVLVVDADPASSDLVAEWLAGSGWRAVAVANDDAPAAAPAACGAPALLLVDLPFPRQDGPARLQRLTARYPGVPIVAMSSTFFASVPCTGAVAATLGVAGVLAKPLAHAALLQAVQTHARPAPPPQAAPQA